MSLAVLVYVTLPITLPQRQAYGSDRGRQSYGFLATFGDLGWGKAEGRGQKAEVGSRKSERYN
ncbi:hypothetical protein [Nostoc commune]|uniref:hypothetical protein n=1 Tax=Nostoc commune TaxID=1178 RepID=UPI0018C54670|nr:hypothetical protein [Nostoc commune]MBG1257968.1 hypothetical protein [Nostoc commune BAE]